MALIQEKKEFNLADFVRKRIAQNDLTFPVPVFNF